MDAKTNGDSRVQQFVRVLSKVDSLFLLDVYYVYYYINSFYRYIWFANNQKLSLEYFQRHAAPSMDKNTHCTVQKPTYCNLT